MERPCGKPECISRESRHGNLPLQVALSSINGYIPVSRTCPPGVCGFLIFVLLFASCRSLGNNRSKTLPTELSKSGFDWQPLSDALFGDASGQWLRCPWPGSERRPFQFFGKNRFAKRRGEVHGPSWQ